MLRVIQEFHPTWIIGENVAGIINLALEQVCTDLEDSGYEVQPFVIPAVAVNAPHRRDRVWIVAYAAGDGGRGIAGEVCQKDGGQDGRMHIGAKDADRHATDTGWEHGESGNSEGMETNKTQRPTRPTDIERQDKDVTDTEAERLEGGDSTGNGCTGGRPPEHPWDRPWLEVAIETCSRDVRMDDGLPTGLDFSGYTKAGHRVERLKSLGNAIVPQIAYEIMKVMNRYKEER
jgi:DNA (cytosine-5)-methyltransferase 1